MAGIEFNFSNVFMFFSSIIPFLLVFFMVMISIFDYNIKGFIYIFGLFLAYGITIPLQNTLNTKIVSHARRVRKWEQHQNGGPVHDQASTKNQSIMLFVQHVE